MCQKWWREYEKQKEQKRNKKDPFQESASKDAEVKIDDEVSFAQVAKQVIIMKERQKKKSKKQKVKRRQNKRKEKKRATSSRQKKKKTIS